MIAEIGAGLSSLNAAKQIVQGLGSLNTTVAVNDAKINLQSLILDAQQGLFAAQQAEAASAARIAQLEQQIVSMENWQAEAERYEAADTGSGAIAYRLKADMKGAEPEHWLCADCFHAGKKTFLQPETYAIGRVDVLKCAPCKSELILSGLRRG